MNVQKGPATVNENATAPPAGDGAVGGAIGASPGDPHPVPILIMKLVPMCGVDKFIFGRA